MKKYIKSDVDYRDIYKYNGIIEIKSRKNEPAIFDVTYDGKFICMGLAEQLPEFIERIRLNPYGNMYDN